MAGKKGQKQTKSNELSPRHPEFYKSQHYDWTDEQCIEAAKKFKRSCNYQCIEYYEVRYPELSHEEHLELKNKLLIQKRGNNPLNLEYYKLNYPGLSSKEQEEKWHMYVRSQNFQCIEYYKVRYPNASEEECNKMLADAIKSYTSKRDMSGENNGMHHSRTTELQRRQISPRCIEFYELRYPDLSHEEHLDLLNGYFAKNRIAVKNAIKQTNIEYYLNKGMSEEEAKIALHNRQSTFTLDKCIKKYGNEQGQQVFLERQQKWLAKLYKSFQSNGDGRSKQSKFAKDIIKACCKYLGINVPKKEKYINGTKCVYAYDFTYKNIIIEFNGDYWHCNPKLYDGDFLNKVKQKTAQEIWDYDLEKTKTAESYGYSVLTIWEYDYNKNPQEEINKCINFINEHVNTDSL